MNVPAAKKFRDPSLVDFGTDSPTGAGGPGRRLELLGGILVDRPLAHDGLPPRGVPAVWRDVGATFHDGGGGWSFASSLPDPWYVRVPLEEHATGRAIAIEIRPAPSGQVGLFLEQAPQWRWLFASTLPGARLLSLFAHSGTATLAMAAAGAEVTHVDASRQATAMARRNAAASGLDAAPIRWICDDARAFVAREVRRGVSYDGVVLDPPSWGHGTKGQAFSIDRDLLPLLEEIASLLAPARRRIGIGPILLTCHSPRWHHRRLRDTLMETLGLEHCESDRLTCTDASGRSLALGDYARHATPR